MRADEGRWMKGSIDTAVVVGWSFFHEPMAIFERLVYGYSYAHRSPSYGWGNGERFKRKPKDSRSQVVKGSSEGWIIS